MAKGPSRKEIKAALKGPEKMRFLASMLIPERREQGFTHVRLRGGSDCGDGCQAAVRSSWAIDRYERHLDEHPTCQRSVGTWLKGTDGRG